jgi:hypothetical protein
MHLHDRSLRVSAAAFALALAGCSSDPGIPGSGTHYESASSGGGSGGSGSSGGGSSGSSGASSGSSGGAASSSGGSSSSSGGSVSPGMMITADATWASGYSITSNVTIVAGVTVTIAPGATVNVSGTSTINVLGTLQASAASDAATLTGTAWTGILVGSGGTLSLDGVNITGASTAIATATGATSAEYDDATITGASTPFNLVKGTTLGTKHANVTGTLGPSLIAGSFTASYLDYDSNGNQGIVTVDPTAIESIEDSTLHGSGPVADMVISQTGAASIHIAYTNITNVHCGFHFDTITAFDVSYTNVETNAYGFMLYGSGGNGTRSVTYSNVDQNTIAFDTEGQNGPITFSNDYITGTQNLGDAVTVSDSQSAAVPGTGPRAQ